ncbi:MAG: hypothetical protein RLZZ350_866 [Verrucomicrobiota bacterium]|jgi:hypothetical protein
MKTLVALAAAFCFAVLAPAQQTNLVTGGNGTDYTINSQNDPAFTLVRGVTYIFRLSGISSHPFWIKSALGGNFSGGTGQFTTGVTGNGNTTGDLIFVVPTNAPNALFYQCGNHGSMNGTLTIINPPTPPTFSIGGLVVSNRVVLRHAGTNTFTYTPQFTTNLVTTNWLTLTVQSNRFLNGTNEIFCGLPTGSNVFFRLRAQ